MRLRTKMVGATALALVGLTLAVQRWAEAPLLQGPSVQGRPAPQAAAPPRAPPSSAAGVAVPAPRRPALPPAEATMQSSNLVDGTPSAAVAPGAIASEQDAAEPSDTRAAQLAAAPDAQALAAPSGDEAERREVSALLLSAARELATAPTATAAEQSPASELPRDAAELEPVPLETGLPRVELATPSARAEPAARIDLATGAGLEATQPLPAEEHAASLPAQDASAPQPEAEERDPEDESAEEPDPDLEQVDGEAPEAPLPYR